MYSMVVMFNVLQKVFVFGVRSGTHFTKIALVTTKRLVTNFSLGENFAPRFLVIVEGFVLKSLVNVNFR